MPNITKENATAFMNYVNKYGYFHNGRYCVDFNGKTYDVAGMIKLIRMLGVCEINH